MELSSSIVTGSPRVAASRATGGDAVGETVGAVVLAVLPAH